MPLFEKLKQELAVEPAGTFAPYYFRYLGYRKKMAAPLVISRASGIYSLFTETKPCIFHHDLIVGSKRCLYTQVDETVLAHAERITQTYGERTFKQGNDHFTPDYARVLSVGIPGLQKEVAASMEKHRHDEEKSNMLLAMQMTLDGFLKMIENYKEEAVRLQTADSGYDQKRLSFIVKNCAALLNGAPQTFAEALQLVWFCHVAFELEGRFAMALGRMDQYLYPFYQKDMREGHLTREEAIELLENTYIKIPVNTVNICVGGTDIHGNSLVNELSYCVLWAVKNCNIPGPNLSASISDNTPDAFLDECLKSIGTGLGYPALMNDRINMAALRKYGYAEEDLHQYTMVGCIENFITGKQPPWSDGRFDPPRFFDYVFFRGISKFSDSVGIDQGDVSEIHSMQEFMERYEAQLAYGAEEYYRVIYNHCNSLNPKHYPSPFLSCFCDDCIGRGLDINDGGSIYPFVHGVALMGVGTVADSLAAIEKVVFVDQAATLTDIKNAIACNFEGYEELQALLLAAPKYGNNDDFADKYAVWFLDYLSGLFRQFKTHDGGHFYVGLAANIQNVSSGKETSATPDGRKQGEPLSDAGSPTFGRDKRGATATFHSVTKNDFTKAAMGSVINQKYSPSMFQGQKLVKLRNLIRTYFKNGGQEVQINATSRQVLLDAMEHPENYQNLVVRVSGYSDYYVRLDRDVQLDILNRTQQN